MNYVSDPAEFGAKVSKKPSTTCGKPLLCYFVFVYLEGANKRTERSLRTVEMGFDVSVLLSAGAITLILLCYWWRRSRPRVEIHARPMVKPVEKAPESRLPLVKKAQPPPEGKTLAHTASDHPQGRLKSNVPKGKKNGEIVAKRVAFSSLANLKTPPRDRKKPAAQNVKKESTKKGARSRKEPVTPRCPKRAEDLFTPQHLAAPYPERLSRHLQMLAKKRGQAKNNKKKVPARTPEPSPSDRAILRRLEEKPEVPPIFEYIQEVSFKPPPPPEWEKYDSWKEPHVRVYRRARRSYFNPRH